MSEEIYFQPGKSSIELKVKYIKRYLKKKITLLFNKLHFKKRKKTSVKSDQVFK